MIARVGTAEALSQRERISSLSSVIRDHRMAMGSASRRDRLLGVNSSSSLEGGIGSFNEANEFKEEDVWGITAERSTKSSLDDGRGELAEKSSEALSKRRLALEPSGLGLSSIARSSNFYNGGVGRVTSASRMIPQMVAASGGGGGGDNGRKVAAAIQHQSAPVNVPDWSRILRSKNRKDRMAGFDQKGAGCDGELNEADLEDEDEGLSVERLPPHELVARSQRTTFSVFEGAGRTLKGRDLSRVRNAVLKQTGFL